MYKTELLITLLVGIVNPGTLKSVIKQVALALCLGVN
jgi:hypothetical protein